MCDKIMTLIHFLVDKIATISQTTFAFFYEWNICILIRISLQFIPKGPIDNKSALVKVMTWRRTDDKAITEPKLT